MKLLRLIPLLAFIPVFFSATLPASEPPSSSTTSSSTTNLLKPTVDPKSWQFEEADLAHGTIKADDDALALTVTKVDGTDWHLQAFQAGLGLTNSQEYVVTFQAKASAKRIVQLYVSVNEDDYHSIGLDKIIELTPEWKSFKFTFKAEGPTPKNNRLGFLVGQEVGTVWIKDIVMGAK